MSLDEWKIRSRALPIRIPKIEEKVVIGTYNNKYWVLVKSLSKDLVRGKVISTPPEDKHFQKGDDVVFHMDNIL